MKRILSKRLKDFLDDELSQLIVNPMSCFLEAADACVGVMEEGGEGKGQLVEAFQKTVEVGYQQDWSMAFIQAMAAYVEDRFCMKSNILLTECALLFWEDMPRSSRVPRGKAPQPGDIVIYQFGSSSKGHAGIVVKSFLRALETIEGCAIPSGVMERDGKGVARRIRAMGGTSTMQLVGFIRIEFRAPA